MYADPHSHFVTILWWIWIGVSVGAFLVLEFLMLGLHRPQDTLSANVWRMEQFTYGQPIGQWSFTHLAFMALFTFIFGWLFFHFGFGMWR